MKKLVTEATMLQFLPHLQAIKIDETQVIFSRTNNIGYIENGILFIRPEYLPGAAKNNVFIDQDIKTLQEALKLTEVITETGFTERNEKRMRVQSLLLSIKASKSLEKIQALALEAVTAGEKTNDTQIVAALNEIAEIINIKQNEVPPVADPPLANDEKENYPPADGKKMPTKKELAAAKKTIS